MILLVPTCSYSVDKIKVVKASEEAEKTQMRI